MSVSDERLAELAAWTPGPKTSAMSAGRDEWIEMARELQELRKGSRIDRVTGLDPDSRGLDEIVAHGANVHMERLSNCAFFLAVTAGADEARFWFSSREAINVTNELDHSPPVTSPELQEAGRLIESFPTSIRETKP